MGCERGGENSPEHPIRAPRVSRVPLRVWRIGDRAYPIFSAEGARLNGGRWNSPGVPVIYAAKTLEGAMLELRAHTAGLPPPGTHGAVWADLPRDLSVERVARSEIAGVARRRSHHADVRR